MDIHRRGFLGAGVITALGASRALNAEAIEAQSSIAGEMDGRIVTRLETYVREHIENWGLPGLTVAIVAPMGRAFVRAGYAELGARENIRADHLVQVGSISKMMAGLTFWSLVDEGRADASARLSEVMPELAIDGGDEITIQHLLNHTSGLPGGAPMILDGGLWTGFTPGTSWEYCNVGYRILGRIIERLDGRPFPDVIEARLFRPLGMNASKGAMRSVDRARYLTGYQPNLLDRPSLRPCELSTSPWVDSQEASGCIASTADDMATFAGFLARLGQGDGAPVLSPDSARRFLANEVRVRTNRTYANGVNKIQKGGRSYLHHTGGMVGFSSSLHVDPAVGVGAFASANIHYARGYRPRQITKFACDALRAAMAGESLPTPPSSRSYVSDGERFSGVWTSIAGARVSISTREGQLFLDEQGARYLMQPVGSRSFATDHPAFAKTGIDFDLEEGRPIRAWAGGVEMHRQGASFEFKQPFDGSEAYIGHYTNDNRWALATRVYARGDRLHIKSANFSRDLRRDKGGWAFVTGRPTAARISFDSLIDGRFHRVIGSGEISYRVAD